MSRQTRRSQNANSTVAKGRMVEAIVASMYEEPGVKVERNVRLTPAGSKGRKREIDVLLSRDVAGYPVRIAIECKNEVTPIGAKDIDAFIGKLQYLGIPVQHGIFVSASGYTVQAKERATHDSLRLLTLSEVSRALPDSVTQALQTILFVMLVVGQVSFENFVNRPMSVEEAYSFYDNQGELRALVPELIWNHWMAGHIPPFIGTSDLKITMPPGWYQLVAGRLYPISSFTAKVQVVGLLATLTGAVSTHQLVNASDGTIERMRLNASFPEQDAYPLTRIESEATLASLTEPHGHVTNRIGRISAPRIQFWDMLWPPSDRAKKALERRLQAVESGEIPESQRFDARAAAGNDVSVLFERTWEESV